jgi:hypothetical protein
MRNSSVIDGRRYDASTGQIIEALRSANTKTAKVIDGFVSRPAKNAAERPQMKSAHIHSHPQKGRTLRREGLKKPAGSHNDISKPTSHTKLDTQLRAKAARMHHRVSRFGNPIRSTAAQPPAVSGEYVKRPEAKAQAVPEAMPSMVTSVSHQKLERLLDEALARADAHKQALKYHAARHFWQKRWFNGPGRWLAFGGALVLVLIVLFVAWQKIPALSMKVAGLKAHVSATVPAYKPDGFTMASPARAEDNAVKVTYKSSAQPQQKYEVTQSASSLTSTSLSQSVVPKGTSVQTSQVAGNTIYIYGPHNDAAWVNNGVLYKIKDNAGLSSDQLIKIAGSINP